jgi:acyl carrier protein
MTSQEHLSAVIDVITEMSGVTGLQPDVDFYESGVTSVQALTLLLELEARFDAAIPDDRFIASRTPRELSELVIECKTP